jgi:hypothetical protein
MPLSAFINSLYLFAALALAVFILTGLLVNNRAERREELKTIAASLLDSPAVIQGVWIVILMMRIGIELPFSILSVPEGKPFTPDMGLLKIAIAAIILFPVNLLLRHKANTAADSRGAWRVSTTVISTFLMANLIINHLTHEAGSNSGIPMLSYTDDVVFLILFTTFLLLMLLSVLTTGRQPMGMKIFGLAAWWLLATVMVAGLFTALFITAKYTLGWLFEQPFMEAVMSWGIKLSPALIIAILTAYMLRKAIRTKKAACIAPAFLLCLPPLFVCFYYFATVESHSFSAAVIAFIVHLFSLLLLAIWMAFFEGTAPGYLKKSTS